MTAPNEPTDVEVSRAYLEGFDDHADIIDMPERSVTTDQPDDDST